MDAAKKKALSPAGLAVLRFMLLLVVTLFLPQTRVWGVEAAPQHASGKIAFASASAIGVIAPVLAYDASDCRVAADTEGIAYRAIDPQYAGSTAQNGFFQSGAAGRLGNDGIYANSTMEGAISEFSYHNPGITPSVFEVKYPLSPTLQIDPPSGYFSQPLPFTGDANILEAPSLRAPGTTNLLIRQGAMPGLQLQ